MWTNRRCHIDYGLTGFRALCLGMTYLAKPRRLTDFEETLGRLYMTVLDFSLLQRSNNHNQLMKVLNKI